MSAVAKNAPVRVVKYGGSVLRDRESLSRVAAHAASVAATGARTIAVVSAFHGRTDALLAVAARFGGPAARLGDAPTDLLVATGELEAVAATALALRERGADARALAPHELGVRTHVGADGVRVFDVERSRLRAHLRPGRVVVVPGFLGVAADFGRVTTLGRGGSDLTAVVLADAFGAACAEFVKDVPGLFSADPHAHEDAAHLPFATYAEARALVGDGVRGLMPLALLEAERRGVRLVLGSLDDARTTVVGPRGEA
jgi:aspartate kinase